MVFLINAYNLKLAGGLNVGINFVNQLKNYPEDQFYVYAPAGCGYENYASGHVFVKIVPTWMTSYFLRGYLDGIWFKKELTKVNPDVIFSMGNFALPFYKKQGILFHYPYLIYPYSRVFKLRLKDKLALFVQYYIFKWRLKYANIVFPQTKVAGDRLRKYYDKGLNILPVPNAYTQLEDVSTDQSSPLFEKKAGLIYLLCLTKYYTHKNIEILIPLAQIFRNNGANFRIITTIGADQHPLAHKFIKDIEKFDLAEYIINLGPVKLYDVPGLYQQSEALLLPTLMESFTATYVDAMHFGKPIFTSDIDFARDICGEAALYFNPNNANDIFKCLSDSFKSPALLDEKINTGRQRVGAFPNWKMVADMYISALKKL